jgi:hypothetical protein
MTNFSSYWHPDIIYLCTHKGKRTPLKFALASPLTVQQALKRSFDSMVLLVSWSLWKEHNRRTFDHKSVSPSELVTVILEEADAWIGAGFGSLALLTALVA